MTACGVCHAQAAPLAAHGAAASNGALGGGGAEAQRATAGPRPSGREVRNLAEMGALTTTREESAGITVLGRMAIALPLEGAPVWGLGPVGMWFIQLFSHVLS